MSDELWHQALVAIACDLASGERHLKKMVRQIELISQIESISSVYKKNHSDDYESLNSQLWVVVRIKTKESAEGLNSELRKIGDGGTQFSKGMAILLTYDQQINLLRDLPLPHPMLQGEKVVLFCASEAWGQYRHPILGQSLNELVMLYAQDEPLEMFFQGTQLL